MPAGRGVSSRYRPSRPQIRSAEEGGLVRAKSLAATMARERCFVIASKEENIFQAILAITEVFKIRTG
ncbi:protein of unknown function [Methylorubrum extorquens]|uniref:Uncharacterized protein n=1 Tax=Methylorubrum extorquens TaxID=408 RepID=A0A2N9ALC2_METEX|nr:protein of unknown function [Methylorubrum extorquens]